jgi:5-hydroxyisourate hydrolase-like protein (transthyretin family)
MATTTKHQGLFTVLGKISNANGRPLANLKVEAYDLDMRERQALANAFTYKEGKYELK